MITIERITVIQTADELAHIRHLYLAAGWIEAKDEDTDELIRKIIANTYCFAIARDGDKIIGMGRSISDNVSDAYIQDVTVLPSFRKHGIGSRIIDFLVDYLHSHGIGWVGLISEPGYESFYQKLGFATMEKYTPFIYTGK
jgi:ribosomal protein S18 acetylase RimI-like enzyme